MRVLETPKEPPSVTRRKARLDDLFRETAITISRVVAREIVKAPNLVCYSASLPDGEIVRIGDRIYVRDRENAEALLEVLRERD